MTAFTRCDSQNNKYVCSRPAPLSPEITERLIYICNRYELTRKITVKKKEK